MDPVRFGRQIRALRRRRGWRQLDVAGAVGLSRATISRVELGHAEELTVRGIEAVARALGARLELQLSWNGEALDRLLDDEHAALVEHVALVLRSLGWLVRIEVSFNIRGERGSIDILAFAEATHVVLVVEAKSVVPDVQAMLFVLDRKRRLAVEIAAAAGWDARSAGRVLVVRADRTTRRRIDRHGETFRATLPARTVEVRRWLEAPDPMHAISGIWFAADARPTSARHRMPGPARTPVRASGPRAPANASDVAPRDQLTRSR